MQNKDGACKACLRSTAAAGEWNEWSAVGACRRKEWRNQSHFVLFSQSSPPLSKHYGYDYGSNLLLGVIVVLVFGDRRCLGLLPRFNFGAASLFDASPASPRHLAGGTTLRHSLWWQLLLTAVLDSRLAKLPETPNPCRHPRAMTGCIKSCLSSHTLRPDRNWKVKRSRGHCNTPIVRRAAIDHRLRATDSTPQASILFVQVDQAALMPVAGAWLPRFSCPCTCTCTCTCLSPPPRGNSSQSILTGANLLQPIRRSFYFYLEDVDQRPLGLCLPSLSCFLRGLDMLDEVSALI